jgi:hypothetical protein
MEVLARDLRSLGLYTARSLSYDGVEYEMLEHALTPEQRGIYDAYALAFGVIHRNLSAALEAANITGESGGTLNRQAKSAARSAFESAKQRFFGHLLTSMKTPTAVTSPRGNTSWTTSPIPSRCSSMSHSLTAKATSPRARSRAMASRWNAARRCAAAMR